VRVWVWEGLSVVDGEGGGVEDESMVDGYGA
jgi:hypothetical protein